MKKIIFISLITLIAAAIFFPQKNSFAGSAYPYFLKRDPFQTFLYAQRTAASFKKGELPLLRYSISSLKVVGIMNRRGKYFAMLQTPDNRSYIITVGSLVGVNRATVVSINENEVGLVERTYNILGRMQSMKVVMHLR
jgi:Tfp pilus assembly protein PilP